MPFKNISENLSYTDILYFAPLTPLLTLQYYSNTTNTAINKK